MGSCSWSSCGPCRAASSQIVCVCGCGAGAFHPGSVQVRGHAPLSPAGLRFLPAPPAGGPCFLWSSVVLESRCVSMLASQCFCKSKAALKHVWGPLPGSAHPVPEGPPPEPLQPRACPAGPVPAAQPAQPPHGQPVLPGHLLSFRDTLLSGIFVHLGDVCRDFFYCILSSLLKPETSALALRG